MENKREDLNNTTAFSRSERKAMERALQDDKLLEEKAKSKSREEKNRSKHEEKEMEEILKEDMPLKQIPKELEENTQSIKAIEEEKLQVGELGKTQHFLNMTSEITNLLGDNAVENLYEKEKKESSFNPITWIGLLMIACFGFFIYLVISSGYDDKLLLLIDSGFLLGIVFLFGISIITGKTATKVLSILNLLIIITYAGINTYILYNWNQKLDSSEEEKTPIVENTLERKKLVCIHEDMTKEEIISIENNVIKKIERTLILSDKEELEKMASIFQEENGLTVNLTDKEIVLTFDFTLLDINKYKVLIRDYLEYYRETSDFDYIEEDKISFNSYKESELKNYECKEIKEES